MIDIPGIEKALGLAVQIGQSSVKVGQWFKSRNKKKEEEGEDDLFQSIVDLLRRMAYTNAGNCLKPEIGSEQDRRCSRMVAKGYLVRVPFGGYMLPELVHNHGGRESWC